MMLKSKKCCRFFLTAACLSLFLWPLKSLTATTIQPKTPFNAVLDVTQNQNKVDLEGTKILLYPVSDGIVFRAIHVLHHLNQGRYEYFPSRDHAYQEVIMNKQGAYYLKPAKNLILHVAFPSHGPHEKLLLDLAGQNYFWNDEGKVPLIGLTARQIAAVSKDSGKPALRFWIDENHHTFLREERYDEDGNLNFVSYFSYIHFPSSLPDSLFEIPSSMIIRNYPAPQELQGGSALKAVDFQPIFPKYIPPGFTLVGTYLTEWQKLHKLHLLYSDGLRTISIYENKRPGAYRSLNGVQTVYDEDNQPVELLEKPEGKLIRFPEGQLTIAIVSNLPAGTLQRIAFSLGKPVYPGRWTRLCLYFKRGIRTLKRFFGIGS